MATALPLVRETSPPTRGLLFAGVLAGPFYVLVGLLQVLIRPGFDIRRHALSLMSNGDLGWIQIGNFVISGALVLAAAVGMRRVLLPGKTALWAPLLLGLYGLGLIGAGIFVADPMDGFPPGTPPGPPAVLSWHGPYHFVAGGIGFFGLILACFVFAGWFAARHRGGWAVFSLFAGLFFLGAFMAIGSGSRHPAVVPLFTAAVILTWAWLSALSRLLGGEAIPAGSGGA